MLGQPKWCTSQHHLALGAGHENSAPMAQLYGSPRGTTAASGTVGGGVGGGVDGMVAKSVAARVIGSKLHPRLRCWQQYSAFSELQEISKVLKSASQSYEPCSEHHHHNTNVGKTQHKTMGKTYGSILLTVVLRRITS